MDLLKLMAVGDIILQTRNNKHPFENVRGAFEAKDILFGNLETVLSNQGKEAEKAVLLHSPPEKVRWLKEAGFDILNIANNHILDLGTDGFYETLKVLKESNLTFIGANDTGAPSYTVLDNQGIKLGFLGYTQGGFSLPEKGVWINKIKSVDIITDIESIKPQCDFVIVSLHWGTENVLYPHPQQIDLAHRLIDAGATVILGHHPHVIQGIERYKHGLIAYSLGNFQFDSKVSYTKTNNSIILCLDFSKEQLESYYMIPVIIDQNFAPTVSKEASQELLNLIDNISEPINNGTITWGWWFEEIAQEYLSGNMKSCIIKIKRYGFKHFLQTTVWLLSPFCLICYGAIIKRRLRRFLKIEKRGRGWR